MFKKMFLSFLLFLFFKTAFSQNRCDTLCTERTIDFEVMVISGHPEYSNCIVTKYKGIQCKPSVVYNYMFYADFKIFDENKAIGIICTGNAYLYSMFQWENDHWKSRKGGVLVSGPNTRKQNPSDIKILDFNKISVKTKDVNYLIEYDFEKKAETRTVIKD